MRMDLASAVCEAIHSLRVLEFDYKGKHRVVHPYLHGRTSPGTESLRAIQVGGETSRRIDSGKLWSLSDIQNLRIAPAIFVPDDPKYNPDDSAFVQIHCRVPRRALGPRG
jgi:hypothetical protein